MRSAWRGGGAGWTSGRRRRQMWIYLGAVVVFLYLIGPFLWLITSSLQTEISLLSVPPKWIPDPINLDSYKELLAGAFMSEASGVPYQSRVFLRSLLNSFIVAASVSVLSVGIGSYAAYPLARLRFRGRNTLMFMILATRLIPALALAVPFYLLARNIGALDHLATLIVINLSFALPYIVWLLQSYFRSIPADIEDAGRIDGCSRRQVVTRIIMPLALPGIVSAGILAFLMTWGEFFFALILTSSEQAYTSTVVAAMFATDVDVNYVTIITAGVLAVLPPVIFALIFQRFIVNGLLSGSVKG
jgi:multiple sugar transport system permease protein